MRAIPWKKRPQDLIYNYVVQMQQQTFKDILIWAVHIAVQILSPRLVLRNTFIFQTIAIRMYRIRFLYKLLVLKRPGS